MPSRVAAATAAVADGVCSLFSSSFFASNRGDGARPLPRKGVSIALISDTHGRHRDVEVPDADILIHAGDFTHFGKLDDAEDFNRWLGTLPHRHKVVVNGNHENNAPWQRDVKEVLANATFLKNEGTVLDVDGTRISVFGTDFFWPMKTRNPYYNQIPRETDILVSHGPAKGFVDDGYGCDTLGEHVRRVQPYLLVSGHIHQAHGMARGTGACAATTFVNAANARQGYSMGWEAMRT